MVFEGKAIHEIDETDLQGLVTDSVREGKTIDFKLQLPGGQDLEKKEFLADVTSFSNTSGGYLLIGMEEQAGTASAVPGFACEDIDVEVARLENLIRTGVEPRLPNRAIQPVELASGHWVLVLWQSRSWLAPHRVTLGGHDKFYARNSVGKSPMDVDELRSAFTVAQSLEERVRRFRYQRLGLIAAGETPVFMTVAPEVILHIVPIGFSDPAFNVDANTLWQHRDRMHPLAGGVSGGHPSFEGYITYTQEIRGAPPIGYLQVFRSGVVETVDKSLLSREGNCPPYVPSGSLEEELIGKTGMYLKLLEALEVQPPLFLMLSMIGVRGYTLAARSGFSDTELNQDELLFPEMLIEKYGEDPSRFLRTLFDNLWNAWGYIGSQNYDENGERTARR